MFYFPIDKKFNFRYSEYYWRCRCRYCTYIKPKMRQVDVTVIGLQMDWLHQTTTKIKHIQKIIHRCCTWGESIFRWGTKPSKARSMDATSPWRPQFWVNHADNDFATLSSMTIFKRLSRTYFDCLINFRKSCKSFSLLFVLAAS